MKIAKISTALNLLLIGCLIYVWRNSQRPPAVPPLTAEPRLEIPGEAAEARVTPHATEAPPFRWSQLFASGNYSNFVANLRAAGCPESTVEDIVRGDADRAFRAKRVEAKVDGTQPGTWSSQSQGRLVDRLLGRISTDDPIPSGKEGPVDQASGFQPAPESGRLAAFLQNVDFTPQGANEEQKQQIASLRQNWLEGTIYQSQARANLAISASQPVMNNSSQSPMTETGGTQPSETQTENAQIAGIENTPSSPQAGTATRPSWWRPPSQSMLMAEEAESMLGGMFGSGAALQYEQYEAGATPQN